jgi:hypothetical protein
MMARMTGAGLKQPWPLQAATLRVAKTGIGRLREVSCAVAAAVIRVARGEPSDCPASAALLADVAAAMWVPRYASYVRAGVDTARD